MLTKATETELARVAAAVNDFRALWASFTPPFHAAFAGDPVDIRALDYLDYESLAYPPGGYESAALVWGNVLATCVGFEWATSAGGDLLLRLEEPGYRLVVWPFARVFEAQCRTSPQDGKYNRLTARVAAECLTDPYGSAEVEARLNRLLTDVGGPDS